MNELPKQLHPSGAEAPLLNPSSTARLKPFPFKTALTQPIAASRSWMETRRETMARDDAQNPAGSLVRMARTLAMLSLGACLAGAAGGAAQTPPFVVTTLTTLASYTVPPQVNGLARWR